MRIINSVKTALAVIAIVALAAKIVRAYRNATTPKSKLMAARLPLSHSLKAHGARVPYNASADGAKI